LKQQIAEVCKKLRLSKNISENCDQIQAESHEEYLFKILQQEVIYRETVRKGRLLKQAGFNTIKTFDGYIFDEIRLPPGLEIDDLKQATFVEQKKNLILYGNVGTGKSHLAVAAGCLQQRKGCKVFPYRCPG